MLKNYREGPRKDPEQSISKAFEIFFKSRFPTILPLKFKVEEMLKANKTC